MASGNRKPTSEEFWQFAERERSAERVEREVFYLRQVLEKHAPGRRVIEVGCGFGERAIRLAEAGFEVTGIDASEKAITEAKKRAARSGVTVRFEAVDLLAISNWPLSSADSVICQPWLDLVSAHARRRLLRQIRYHLAADGALIIGHAPLKEISDASPVGRLENSIDNNHRLRSLTELTREVREAGFVVERSDADFTPGLPVTSGVETVNLLGRPLSIPPTSLAVASWRNPTVAGLDLRYAPEEGELLEPSPRQVWNELILSAPDRGADIVSSYAVDDPYGSERGAEALSRFFGFPVNPHQLTFAAGVTSLLHNLCGLADGGLIAAPELVHGDIEAWALARGLEVCMIPEPVTCDQLATEVGRIRPALLHLDRPTFTGQVIALDQLEEMLRIASRVGVVVLIDESPAPYLGPGGSAAHLVNRVDNLIVLRGFTKAYSWGGLRAGYALASEGVARHVRELVAPLQLSELALHAVLKILSAGDIFKRLRERIRIMKPIAIEELEALGLEVTGRHEDLPWVAVSDADETASMILSRCGIHALRPARAPVFSQPSAKFLRLTIPLSDERMALFQQLLSNAARFGRLGGRKNN